MPKLYIMPKDSPHQIFSSNPSTDSSTLQANKPAHLGYNKLTTQLISDTRFRMTRHLGSKVAHHCPCGKSGRCRKHLLVCNKHGIEYYAEWGCSGCIGEAKAKAQKEYEAEQDKKKQKEDDKKRDQDDYWYGKSSRR